MKPRRIAVVALTGVALAAAGGGAIAATREDPEQSILDDAAQRLNVSPKALQDALSAAEAAQVEKAVKAGRLTQGEADRIKHHLATSGHVLGAGRFGPHPMRGRFDHGGPGHAIGAAATALGMTRMELFQQLRSGKSLAAIAKAQGKDLADVKAAVRKELSAGLDQAVTAGRLSRARADEILMRFDRRFDAFAQRSRPDRFGPHRRGFGPGHP